VPEVAAVQTHIEPLAEEARGEEVADDPREIEAVVRAVTGRAPRRTRFLHTDEGVVVHLTLGVDGGASLAEAHQVAGVVEQRIRAALPGVAEVIVHTEP
jgi:divalent metal cation (Fe/Co/Zn/Cd) transporter